MKYKLSEVAYYSRARVEVGELSPENYLSTENILPEFGGITRASSLPAIARVAKYSPGDTLLSNIRPYFKKLHFATSEGGCSNDVLCICAKDKIDKKFLYYSLKSDTFFKYVMATAKGTKMPRGDKNAIMNYELEIPDLDKQKKVVRVLSALDRKIKLNNETNNTLEEIAQKLYDCFIQNLDGTSSRNVALGDVAECKLGGTPSRARPDYWGGNINWINSGAINSFRITEPSELITEDGLKHTSTYILPKGTTVLAITGATLGQVSRMEIEGCANQSVIGILGNNTISDEYIYLTIIKNIKMIINRQTGGAQQHINNNDVKEFKILLPDQQSMDSFTNRVKPLFERISVNCFNNKTLAELRDALLPKLMAGEINLDKVEI